MAYINFNKYYKYEEDSNSSENTELPRKYEQLVLRLQSQNVITQSRYNELMEDVAVDR